MYHQTVSKIKRGWISVIKVFKSETDLIVREQKWKKLKLSATFEEAIVN